MPRKTNPDAAELLALAMARGEKVADWAKQQGVSPRAAYRLAAKPGVRARVAMLRTRMIDEAVGRLSEAAATAGLTLCDLLSAGRPDSIRLGAARAILGSLIDVQDHAELNARVAELEKRFGGTEETSP